jgi:catechol 2,3-dioxygenase-like lactoylglutathione lyase family enzyme
VAYLDLVTLIVRDYDPAIDFFVNVLQFELVQDLPSLTNDGRPKRWVVVRPAAGTFSALPSPQVDRALAGACRCRCILGMYEVSRR